MILPGCPLATLLVDFAETTTIYIAQVHLVMSAQSTTFHPATKTFHHCFFLQVMTQYGFFNATGTVILVVVLHSWNYATNKREGVSHFMITNDLKKSNMQVCKFIQDLFFEEDTQYFAAS